MSSEMREIKAMADAVEYGIALGKLDAPAVFTKMRDLLNLALLARTEAGADRPVAEISELSGAKLIVLYSADEIGHLPKETKLYTHPQDASGDAELFEACYGAMRDAMACIDADDGPGRRNGSALTKLAACRVSIERRTSAMQAKEAK